MRKIVWLVSKLWRYEETLSLLREDLSGIRRNLGELSTAVDMRLDGFTQQIRSDMSKFIGHSRPAAHAELEARIASLEQQLAFLQRYMGMNVPYPPKEPTILERKVAE